MVVGFLSHLLHGLQIFPYCTSHSPGEVPHPGKLAGSGGGGQLAVGLRKESVQWSSCWLLQKAEKSGDNEDIWGDGGGWQLCCVNGFWIVDNVSLHTFFFLLLSCLILLQFILPCFTLPYFTAPYLTSFYLTSPPCFTFAMAYLTSGSRRPWFILHLILSCFTSFYLTSPHLTLLYFTFLLFHTYLTSLHLTSIVTYFEAASHTQLTSPYLTVLYLTFLSLTNLASPHVTLRAL